MGRALDRLTTLRTLPGLAKPLGLREPLLGVRERLLGRRTLLADVRELLCDGLAELRSTAGVDRRVREGLAVGLCLRLELLEFRAFLREKVRALLDLRLQVAGLLPALFGLVFQLLGPFLEALGLGVVLALLRAQLRDPFGNGLGLALKLRDPLADLLGLGRVEGAVGEELVAGLPGLGQPPASALYRLGKLLALPLGGLDSLLEGLDVLLDLGQFRLPLAVLLEPARGSPRSGRPPRRLPNAPP